MHKEKNIESGSGEEIQQVKLSRFRRMVQNIKQDKDFSLFLVVGFFSGIAGGINSTVFNNFLSDTYKLSAIARGIVEFPRELPGALIMLVLGLTAFIGNIRIAAAAMLASALGMIGLGVFSPTFASMMVWMMILSLGMHMFMPLAPAIGMNLSDHGQYGIRLGRFNAYNLLATIVGYAIVWSGFKYLGLSYRMSFIIAAAFYACSAVFLGFMRPQIPKKRKVRLLFRKKYSLYYVLCIVNGARKQVFLTFAPWVLIQVYHLEPPVFAILGVIIAVVSIMTRTVVGNAIDSLGERFVLSTEAIVLIAICLGYAFAANLFPAGVAVVIIAACYIIDNSMSSVEMARSTYVKKIAVDPDDVTLTLSVGTSVDHLVSMSVPVLGGLLWAKMGYPYVFLTAALVAVTNFFLSRKIRI